MAHVETINDSKNLLEVQEAVISATSGESLHHDALEKHSDKDARETSRQQCQSQKTEIGRNRMQRIKKSSMDQQRKNKSASTTEKHADRDARETSRQQCQSQKTKINRNRMQRINKSSMDEQKKSKSASTTENHADRDARKTSRQQRQSQKMKISRNRMQRINKSSMDEQRKIKSTSTTPSTARQCRLVVKPLKSLNVSQDIMTKYLEECLGEKFKFDLEDTKIIKSKTRQFTFVFQSGNQGRKAEQLLKQNIEESGEEINVSILKEDPRVTTQIFLSKSKKELQEKIKLVTEKNAVKIKEITARLDRLIVRKHIPLDEYEKVKLERDALKQKKDELEQQQQEFKHSSSQIVDMLSAQSGRPHSHVQNTVKELRKSFGRECRRLDAALPIYAKKTIIIETIKENQVCIVLGETGSGKSTQMTQYLYEAGFAEKGLIVCTQPRKVAATSLAAHVAREMGGVPGQIVGCRVGGKIQASKTTGIVYATDHLLLNECLKDPSLSKYSCIIIDEAHERSLYSDLLLGMIKKSLAQRPELRVVITSATIDPTLFVAYFDQCPVLKVSGRMFPVDVIWRDGLLSTENYLQEAASTVREIHNKEDQGDILVFLTSPVETERACENLSKMVPDDSLVCLPLHGKLRQEEQRRVFNEETNKRKVVFATNCAETSITIPGIRYVVDTGMVKEMKFEPKRNKSSLEVTTTSKSSAEQRKGRAGRTQAGKCYRLYSEEEYTAMEDGSKPEILRVHLGKAVLKLMELGIEDVTHFEFVESPPLESIELALDALKSLGAIADGKLTDLGHKIARVPVEPRLAKLIFDGIDQGIGAEAVALAAIATVSGSVFFRMGTEEEKQIADRRKVGFCHNGGDLLTLLEVYRQYLEQSKAKRNKWAFDHSLNAKSLRLTGETVKELKLALKHELNIEVPGAIQQNDDTDLKLQRILITCYATNLCVFTGHEIAGYRVVSFNRCVQLHPSSALKFLGATPQFIVFEQLLKTSRDFAINATPVPESWLRDMISKGAVNYDVDDLMSKVLTQVALPCSSDLMTLAFGGLRRQILDQVEEEVSKSCDGCLVVLEKDGKSGQMKVFVASNYTAKAVSVVKDHLEDSRKLLRCEDREEQLNRECQGTRIVWGQGGEVQEVLMPRMYRTVTVSDIKNEQFILDHLKSFGEVVKHSFKEQNGKTRVFATFKKSEDASKAVKGSSDVSLDSNLIVQPRHSMPDDAQVFQFMVRAKWLRRPGKGTGSIEFFNSEDFSQTLGSLPLLIIKSKRVIFDVDKNCEEQIFMRGLNPETSEEDAKSAIERIIAPVKLKNVFIHREPGFETTDDELESQRNSLQERLGIFTTEGQFSIFMVHPRPKNFEGLAYLMFQDAEEMEASIRGLNGKYISGIGIVTLERNFSTTLLCPRNVFTFIKDKLEMIIKQLEQDFGKMLVVKIKDQQKYKRVAIKIRSNCTEHFIHATTVLDKSINGDEIDCKISKTLEILLTNPVKDVLRTIQKDTGTVINQDRRNKVVKIHGSQASQESAKLAIHKFLDDFISSTSLPCEIQLRGPSRPRGLLKVLFKRFGIDLHGLQEIPGVQNIHVEFRSHVLKIISSEEARETIIRCVDECCESLPNVSSELQTENPETQSTCGICLCDFDKTADIYRLACCGHAYDKSCVIQQLKSAEIPLKCVAENCGEPVVWRDLQNLLNQSERKKLAVSALDTYVRGNPDIAKYCPTADCGMVYRVSPGGRRHVCGMCQADICTSCHTQYHSGLTCAMFKSEKQVEGHLEKWMMKDPSNRKYCPKCKTPIEKNKGCNHMTCSQCKSHMCWLCLEVFPSGREADSHQRNCPRRF